MISFVQKVSEHTFELILKDTCLGTLLDDLAIPALNTSVLGEPVFFSFEEI